MDLIRRNRLAGLPAKTISDGPNYKPDILLYDIEGEKIVLKDYRSKPAFWRRTIGVHSIAREAKILKTLNGIEGIPNFRGQPDRYSLAMSFMNASKIKNEDPSVRNNASFFGKLEQLVGEMHKRGVVHLDMKHRSNIMLGDDGGPVILDFASAMHIRRNWFGGEIIFRMFAEADLVALEHWRRKLCPGQIAEGNGFRAKLAQGFRRRWLPRVIADAFLALTSKDKRRDINRRKRRK